MCIICLEYQKYKDAWSAFLMVGKAKSEKVDIDEDHLDEIAEEFYRKYLNEGKATHNID